MADEIRIVIRDEGSTPVGAPAPALPPTIGVPSANGSIPLPPPVGLGAAPPAQSPPAAPAGTNPPGTNPPATPTPGQGPSLGSVAGAVSGSPAVGAAVTATGQALVATGVIDASSILGAAVSGSVLGPVGLAVTAAVTAIGVAGGAAIYGINQTFLDLEQSLRSATPELQAASAQREIRDLLFRRERGQAYGSPLASLAESNQRLEQAMTRLLDTVGIPVAETVASVAEDVANLADAVEMGTRDIRAVIQEALKEVGQQERIILRFFAPWMATLLDAVKDLKPDELPIDQMLSELLDADVDEMQMKRGQNSVNKLRWPLGAQ